MRKHLLLLIILICDISAWAQLQVRGTVYTADDGEPAIGATVRVLENPANVVDTDFDGHYNISVNAGQTLEFNYVGCDPVQKKIGESQTLDVTLHSISVLDEVVVIGYGTMKKSDLTGSVTSVASDKLQKTPAPSLANALQGQAAGVTVNSLSGRPGAAAEVRIRGVGNVTSSSPIYVVDGIITDDISFLSPNDIANTEILKDASATAIYGSRGANGVIIVTTRTGQTGQRARISFDAYAGVQQRWRKLDVMNARDFAETYININGNKTSKKFYAENGFNKWLRTFKGLASSPYYPTVYDPETNPDGFDYASQDTDWQDEVFRDAWIQNY
ncbi:MAG: TonB-dependent receptor plug domain-containing protein, partial [Muribaculaceae bacterium]|nr:TonB-dependent receptor plug domain-containing protein [Muribaculaceae bacterium]